MLDHDIILKSNQLYLVGQRPTDGSGEDAQGLYLLDTRHLSRFTLSLNGGPLKRLSSRVLSSSTAVVHSTNVELPTPDGTIEPQTISIMEFVRLDSRFTVSIEAQNYGRRPLPLLLGLDLAADFRDVFDIRGFPRPQRGSYLPIEIHPDSLVLGYTGVDGQTVRTRLTFDRPVSFDATSRVWEAGGNADHDLQPEHQRGKGLSLPEPPIVRASLAAVLPPGEVWQVHVVVDPEEVKGRVPSPQPTRLAIAPPEQASIRTSNVAFNRMVERSMSDLRTLQTTFPDGTLPSAGIPWYVAPFGRDSLIVGLQTVPFAPARAAGTLRLLAALQGSQVDPWRDEEPGKILHEMRYGEMARQREIPHTPYYGTADATPLFILLFAETVAWTADDALYRELVPHVRRAIQWIEQYGDVDGDGLVEYRSREADGARIVHQGWKDSHDSLHHTDGRPVAGTIALVEVQGYVFAAYARLARVARLRGDVTWADDLRQRAAAVQKRVEETFWMEETGFYAQALDGEKQQVQAITSNPGHLLYCGLPTPERAGRMARRFSQPDLDSGWGIRTLGSSMPTYNPMSYHNGSVWPHDNSLIAAGLQRYGHTASAERIFGSLVAAAEVDPFGRLPELYCGFPRSSTTSDAPVPYPVSCSPQAWAAAAVQLLIATALGLRPDPERRRVLVTPTLPPWLDTFELRDWMPYGERASLHGFRHDGEVRWATEGPIEVTPPAPLLG